MTGKKEADVRELLMGELNLTTDGPRMRCAAWFREAVWECGKEAESEAVRHGY